MNTTRLRRINNVCGRQVCLSFPSLHCQMHHTQPLNQRLLRSQFPWSKASRTTSYNDRSPGASPVDSVVNSRIYNNRLATRSKLLLLHTMPSLNRLRLKARSCLLLCLKVAPWHPRRGCGNRVCSQFCKNLDRRK